MGLKVPPNCKFPADVSRYFNNSVQKFIKCVICSQQASLGTVKNLFIVLKFNSVVFLIYMVTMDRRCTKVWTT